MEEQWKALARTAISELADASIEPLGPSFSRASDALGFRKFQMGRLIGGNVVPLQSVDLDGPTAMLGEASRAIARFNELHKRVVRVFSIYGVHLGVLTDGPLWQKKLTGGPHAAGPLWQSWAQHRTVALQRTDQASERLRSVAAYDLATVDALTVARSFPDDSPSWNAWMRAAENLAVRAEAEALAALQSAVNMDSAVSQEYNAGWVIFNP